MRLLPCLSLLLLTLFLLGICNCANATELPQDKQSAVILAYHRVGEDSYPDSNIRIEQFQHHIDELINNDYNVISLKTLLETINKDQPLPPKTVAITFEGAYKSALENAIPLLNKHNLPYTVFYSAGLASANTGQYTNWKDLKTIYATTNGNLGILPAAYIRLHQTNEEETRRLINSAIAEHRERFGTKPTAFSIPFGEWEPSLIPILKDYNFESIWGLQSSVFYPQDENIILPRFSITENYADIDRLTLILNALPLPIHDITHQVSETITVGFTLSPELTPHKDLLRCYNSGNRKILREDISDNRIELRLANDNGNNKTRINCTLAETATQWRWAGFLLTHPLAKDINNNPEPDALPEPQEQNDEAYSQSQP